MPINISLPSLNQNVSPGQLVIHRNPLQEQIEQAKLQALLQEPALERQRINLETADRARALEALRQTGIHEEGALAEETRFHTGQLAHEEAALKQTKEESEQAQKTKLADVGLAHLGFSDEDKAVTGKFLSKLGYPQLEQARGEQSAEELTQRARAVAGGGRAGVEAIKTANPELYAAASRLLPAETGPTEPEVPTAQKAGALTRLLGPSMLSSALVPGTGLPTFLAQTLGKKVDVGKLKDFWKQYYAGLTGKQGGSNVVQQP